MRLLDVDTGKTTQLFWVLIGVLVAVVALTGKQTDPGIAATGVLLIVMAIFPLYLWMLGWSHGLPLWPVFALSNGVSAALPMLQSLENIEVYTPGEVVVGGMTIVGFLLLGTILWLGMTSRAPAPPGKVLSISQAHAVRYLLIFIGLGILFSSGLIRLPGNMMQITRGVTMSLNLMGLFVLSFYYGRGLLSRGNFYLTVVGLLATVALNLTSLMLAQAFVPVAMAMLGYTLGSGKFPWKVALIAFAVVAILHPGKYEMRERYWGGEATGTLSVATMPTFYGEWFSSGLSELGGFSGVAKVRTGEDSRSSAFERGGNVHMLLMVQRKTPNEVPFFLGATYEPIPRLLVPRFLDSNKGISHAANQMLSVNYGLVELESVGTVSIGWGLIVEAYANFGYSGVIGLAVFLAGFYAFFTRLTVGVPMTSLRFVLGLLAMAAATAQDTMGIFITSQFQGMVGVSLASFFLMRRQPNPYATGDEHTLPQLEGAPEGRIENGSQMPDPHQNGGGPNQASGAGSVAAVRTPMRSAAWMPRSLRMRIIAEQREQAALAARAAAPAPSATAASEASQRPRQVAVPYRNYRRYRG
jgi:hypothetical protein